MQCRYTHIRTGYLTREGTYETNLVLRYFLLKFKEQLKSNKKNVILALYNIKLSFFQFFIFTE